MPHRLLAKIHTDFRQYAQSARNNIFTRMHLGFIRRYTAGIHHFLHDGMVPRELFRLCVQKIGAAVPRMGNIRYAVRDQGTHNRCPHTGEFGIRLRDVKHADIGGVNRSNQ